MQVNRFVKALRQKALLWFRGLYLPESGIPYFRATTLPELLVVMIVGGLVFILAFEGWSNLDRLGRQRMEKREKEGDFFTAVSRLEALCVSADSLTLGVDGLCLHRPSGKEVFLQQEGNYLVASFPSEDKGALRDTLFRPVESLRWKAGKRSEADTDSLYILFRIGGYLKEIGFGCAGVRAVN